MPIAMTLLLASLFVFLAGFNVWNMLTGRGTTPHGHSLWIRIHRGCGYAFIALFVILSYYMSLRVRGMQDELPPRLILHIGLSIALAPLLLTKIIVARYQRTSRSLLAALGIALFVAAFTLVTINLSTHFLRRVSGKLSKTSSLALVAGALGLAVTAYFARGRRLNVPKSEIQAPSVDRTGGQGAAAVGTNLHLRLARIAPQTHDAKTLRFILPREQSFAARPGQFLTFQWMIDGKPITRSYSICSSPTQRGFVEITAKRVEKGCVSVFLHDHARVGLTVTARGPFGRFCFDENKNERIVLIAGGSGVTPMMAMLRYIDDLCLPVDVTLIYCVRTERDVFFEKEFTELQGRMPKFRFVLVLSQPSSAWRGWKGRLRRQILEREIEKPAESVFFLCGPLPFMELARNLLQETSVEPSRILQESFGGAVAQNTLFEANSGSLEIRFSRSAVAHRISPEETVLENSEKNGVLLPSGCRQGVCGTCATRLLSGNVSMETEAALTERMRSEGFILPCVSRPLSDITLDA